MGVRIVSKKESTMRSLGEITGSGFGRGLERTGDPLNGSQIVAETYVVRKTQGKTEAGESGKKKRVHSTHDPTSSDTL